MGFPQKLEENLATLLGAQTKSRPGMEFTTFKAEGRRSDHYATGPLPPENFAFLFSLCALCKGLGLGLGCGCEKNNFSRPEKLIFRHCPCEPQTQCFRLWQIVFSHPPRPWKLGVCPKLGYTGIPQNCKFNWENDHNHFLFFWGIVVFS